MILSDAILINPKRVSEKNSLNPFIAMEDIEPHYRYVKPKTMRKSNSGSKFKNGDTLLARITPSLENGKTAFVESLEDRKVGIGSTEFIVLSGKPGITENLFVYYIARFPEFRNAAIQSMTGTSGRQRVQETVFDDFEMEIPDQDIQLKIINILGKLDDKIKNLRESNIVLEKIIQSIFKSWFVDFDGQTEFVDSELGKIPKGWKTVPIGNMSEFIRGFSYKGTEKFQEPRGFLFVTLNSIKEGGGFKKEYAWLESDRLKERHHVNEMDLIIANTEQTKDARLLATPAIVQFPFYYDKSIGVYSHHITKVKSKYSNLKFYLYSLLLYKQYEIANAYHTGTGVWGFDYNSFQEQYVIIQPSSEILKNFDQIGFNIHSQIVENEKKISILTSIRDSLLPKLMSGEIKVD